MNRFERRREAAKKRTLIRKKVPFGRVKVIDFETGDSPQDDRTVYMHFTKGRMDRRTTVPLLDNLISGSVS